MLQIHHRYYVEDKRYWQYPEKALISLCEECHQREEDALFDAKRDLQRAIGWRDGEAKHMNLLAEALDKAPEHYSIGDIIGAITELIQNKSVLNQVVAIRRKKKPTDS